MNSSIAKNFAQLKPRLLFLPLVLLAILAWFLFQQNALSATSYVEIQQNCFLALNAKLSQFPNLIYNFTQLGDALVMLSIISIFLIIAPKIWEAIIPASLFSLIFSKLFKTFFDVPRPAQIFDHDSFHIIGKTLVGFSSFPSGHSITIFTILTVLMIGFMPKSNAKKIIWILLIIVLGLFVASTRIGVGAHHPLDAITGSIIGFICGILGIVTMQKFNFFKWIELKKCYPFFILVFVVAIGILVIKINKENLPVYYISILGLLASLYKIVKIYVQK